MFLRPNNKCTGTGGREIALGSTSDAPDGIAFGFTWDAHCERREKEGERERAIADVSASSNVFINSAASEIAMCNIWLFA